MSEIFKEIRDSKSFLIVKEIAKLACKTIIPGGGIIIDAIDSFDAIEKQSDQQKVEEILKVVMIQGQELLKLVEQMHIENAEQFATISKLPFVNNYLNKISDELKNISGIKEFLTQEFNELKVGQKEILDSQKKILIEIQNSSKKPAEQIVIHKQRHFCPICKGEKIIKRNGSTALLLGCGLTTVLSLVLFIFLSFLVKNLEKSGMGWIGLLIIIFWLFISEKLEKIKCSHCEGKGFIEL